MHNVVFSSAVFAEGSLMRTLAKEASFCDRQTSLLSEILTSDSDWNTAKITKSPLTARSASYSTYLDAHTLQDIHIT